MRLAFFRRLFDSIEVMSAKEILWLLVTLVFLLLLMVIFLIMIILKPYILAFFQPIDGGTFYQINKLLKDYNLKLENLNAPNTAEIINVEEKSESTSSFSHFYNNNFFKSTLFVCLATMGFVYCINPQSVNDCIEGLYYVFRAVSDPFAGIITGMSNASLATVIGARDFGIQLTAYGVRTIFLISRTVLTPLLPNISTNNGANIPENVIPSEAPISRVQPTSSEVGYSFFSTSSNLSPVDESTAAGSSIFERVSTLSSVV